MKKLTPSDGSADDRFGFSVAISGSAIEVGARLDDGPLRDTGSVYLYV